MATRRKGPIGASDLGRYGSIPANSVNVDRAARGLGASKREVNQALSRAQADQRNTIYRTLSGRRSADLANNANVRGMLQAAYGPGPRGGAVNARAAAADLGVSVSTVRRWAAGSHQPSKDHLVSVRTQARKAATTQAGRKAAVSGFRNSDKGRSALQRGTKMNIGGDQGPQDYPRDRSISVDVGPEDMEAMLSAYEEGGDEGLHNWMMGHIESHYLAGWELLTIDSFELGEPQ